MIRFNRFKDGVRRCITMSYDDGMVYDFQLIEIFNKYGVKGTFHLNGHRYLEMNDAELKEVADKYKGHEVSCHTIGHPHLERNPMQLCTKDIVDDKIILEKMCGYIVRGMSYPYGSYDDTVINAMKAGGMEYSRTARSTNGFSLPSDWLAWHPTCHHKADLHGIWDTMEARLQWLDMPVMYIWGHSFEFNNDKNWDKMEKFCDKVAGHPDTWFATNIEIVDYVNATRNLKFSWDRRLIYNPSALDVWIEVDSEAVKIPAGETVDLGYVPSVK